ncbi:MAG: substrate-binding domain-containing protein [Spirochaetaceae bacterium]|jgi:D-xylose transport system substrate-binding protein|nr:substrate-binding domain-containing protein [Spirochaetaceae bacterium]
MKNQKKLIMAAFAAVLALGFGGCAKKPPKSDGKLLIGISLPTQREERWVLDRAAFEKAAAAAGIEIALQIADNDAARQQSQCENLIAQGIDILVLAPHDGDAAKNIVDIAHDAGIPVVSYDRLVFNANVDLYVTFDQLYIGFLMGDYMAKHLDKGNIVFLTGDPGDNTCVYLRQGAMNAIQPKIDSGDYKIVLEQECRDWQPSEALKHVENALTANNNNIQGVIAPNDGTAGGVIQALATQGLAGKVVVTGQDSETDAVKRIIEGTQSMTVFFDVRDMAAAAFDAAVKIARKQDPGANGKENDGTYEVAVLQFPAKQVTKDNYKELLVDSGYMSADALK